MTDKAVLIVAILVAIILFAGTPDIHDAIVSRLMVRCAP